MGAGGWPLFRRPLFHGPTETSARKNASENAGQTSWSFTLRSVTVAHEATHNTELNGIAARLPITSPVPARLPGACFLREGCPLVLSVKADRHRRTFEDSGEPSSHRDHQSHMEAGHVLPKMPNAHSARRQSAVRHGRACGRHRSHRRHRFRADRDYHLPGPTLRATARTSRTPRTIPASLSGYTRLARARTIMHGSSKR
jgi:hypothetical protein